MTTVRTADRMCAVCGVRSPHHVIVSTSSWGPSDLDGRPAEPARSALSLQIEVCPECGYAAPDVSLAPYPAHGLVKSDRYRALLLDPAGRSLAGAFRCSATILQATGDATAAAWAMVSAAWACDDAGEEGLAEDCRARAGELFDLATRGLDEGFASRYDAHLILVDLERRSGQMPEAYARCVEALGQPQDDGVRLALEFERDLIERGDRKAHTATEAKEARAAKARSGPFDPGEWDQEAYAAGCPVCGETNTRTMSRCSQCGRFVHLVCSVRHRHEPPVRHGDNLSL